MHSNHAAVEADRAGVTACGRHKMFQAELISSTKDGQHVDQRWSAYKSLIEQHFETMAGSTSHGSWHQLRGLRAWVQPLGR